MEELPCNKTPTFQNILAYRDGLCWVKATSGNPVDTSMYLYLLLHKSCLHRSGSRHDQRGLHCITPMIVALYGAPAHLYTDNGGTNFVGAIVDLSALKDIMQAASTQESLQQMTFNRGFRWHFTPRRTPHFGGHCMRSIKTLLRKIVDEHVLRMDKMTTIFYEAAAVLKWRPLTYMDTHSMDGDTSYTWPFSSWNCTFYFAIRTKAIAANTYGD